MLHPRQRKLSTCVLPLAVAAAMGIPALTKITTKTEVLAQLITYAPLIGVNPPWSQ